MSTLTTSPQQQTAINGMVDLITKGAPDILAENITGSVAIIIPELPKHSFIVKYSDKVSISPLNDKTKTNLSDTQITIPIATINAIYTQTTYLDWRDPDIIGSMTIKGDLNLANSLGKSLLRPNAGVIKTFNECEQLHTKRNYKDLTIADIAYLDNPTQMQILEYMDNGIPVVIRGLKFDNQTTWNLDKLVKRYADSIVRVRSATQKQTMSEFITELKQFEQNPKQTIIEGFDKPYTEGATLPREMWDDFGPLFFNAQDFIPPQLWLGAVPTHVPTSSLHRDPLNGFLLQVIGRKRLDLYSSDQAPLLYPMTAYNNYQPCRFKPEAPDYTKHPKAKAAKCISITLNTGELIIQPAGWFHQVYAEDSPNMSVSYFWRYPPCYKHLLSEIA